MKRIYLLVVSITGLLMAKAQQNDHYLLVGSYTPAGHSEGIHVYKFNSGTGEFSPVGAVEASNASYLTVSPDEKYVYAVYENANDKGSIAAFSFDKKNGTLKFINKKPSGDHPCYVTISNNGKWVIAGNYSGGSLSAFAVNADGSLEGPTTTIQHEGSGKDPKRQDKPHVHCTCLSPDNKRLYVPDLGMDKVMIYAFNDQTGKLQAAPQPFVQATEPGSGPRHFIFHPNKKFAYLIEELSGTIEAYEYNGDSLKHIQRISTVQPGRQGYPGSADIHISSDGRFLYASNRGVLDDIVIYTINSENGQLTNAGFQSAIGKAPRNFSLDPAANFLLVANQDSDEIIIFKRNKETGLLSDTGKRIKLAKPVCLKWISLPATEN